ncbi:HIT domain-containing protein [Candidatus Gottesmanbacteria bacterium]|nr:HIT domain-containing protein [Candidatus Gottesmanbacteria bacterium]
MNDCIFCQVVSGRLPSKPIYQDDEVIVIPDLHSQAPVHLLVIPKTHISQFTEASDEILTKMNTIIKQIIQDQQISSYRLVVNGTGAAVIDHLHVHILGKIDKFRSL